MFAAHAARGDIDFNGDGKADIVWFNGSTGMTSTWLMSGTATAGAAVLLTDPNWKMAGTADFNGDGKSDILWYNASSGTTAMWLMNGTAVAGASVLLTDPNWKPIATPDFNGDGKADILWYNAATGTTAVWLMNGTAVAGAAVLLTDPNWKVLFTADFDGDGKSDILWYNGSTGTTAMWLMNGTTVAGAAVLLSDPNLVPTATADLNGDGKSDILWHNAATGTTALWLMSGTSYIGAAVLLADPAWRVIGTPDFNGDGKADILWHNASSGTTSLWLMSGTTYIGAAVLLADSAWHVIGTPDFNGDGKADILWHNALTGTTSTWLMNGTAIASAAGLLYDGNWAGNTSSATADLLRSPDQILAENFGSDGTYQIVWNLNSAGAQIAGTNYATYDWSTLLRSPLTNGPQTVVQTSRVNMTASLPIVLGGPGRYLKNGVILVVPSHDQTLRSSFVGTKVRVDHLAIDGTTVAYSQLRSNYSVVPLVGDIKANTPVAAPNVAHFLNSFFTNTDALRSGVTWPAGAAYEKFDSVFVGDRYSVFDCSTTSSTVDANPIPCFTNTSLSTALASGIASASDGMTYHSADGAFSTVGGVQMWVASAARPVSATLSSAQQFRIYFSLNGNVYTGGLTHDGEPFGGSYYISTPGVGTAGLTFLPFNIRLNRSAATGLAAAVAY